MIEQRTSNERVDPRCGCPQSQHPGHETYHVADCWVISLVGAHHEINLLREAARSEHDVAVRRMKERDDCIAGYEQIKAALQFEKDTRVNSDALTAERDRLAAQLKACGDVSDKRMGELYRLRAALERIESHLGGNMVADRMRSMAREALAGAAHETEGKHT